MATARYDTRVDLSNENMSQTLLALLIGEGRAVLDVGCATGYTAELLRTRGCRVDGIEYDPGMAAQAAAHVDRLEVGDVQQMDLVGMFGEASYDAIAFGDVLEHLTRPVEVLRACRPLLRPGGAVVASIPNVAHGAVRLALLSGRFRYTENGLLDDTHVRFFTRETVLALFADAGYEVVDLRRTELGVFETEVQVAEGDYPPELVRLVAADPESTTYQFVCRAVPAEEADPAAVSALRASEQARLAAAAGPGTAPDEALPGRLALEVVPSARVGVWGSWDLDDLGQALVGRVVSAELARRLPGVLLRFAAPYPGAGGSRTGLGEPVEALGPAGAVRSAHLGGELDAALVVGELRTDAGERARRYVRVPRQDDPYGRLLEPTPGLPVLWGPVTVDGEGPFGVAPGEPLGGTRRPLPDPGLLAARVLPLGTTRRRAAFLRSAGWLPHSDRVVTVHLAGGTDPAPVIEALDQMLEADPGLALVTLELDTSSGDGGPANAVATAFEGRALLCPVDAGVDSALALVAVSDLVVSTSGTLRAAARSYGVPSVEPAELPGARVGRRGEAGPLAEQHQLDSWFDEVADAVRLAVAPADERAVLSPAERYAAMERAHAVMRARTSIEVLHATESVPVVTLVSDASRAEAARLQAELDALRATLSFRALERPRALYARLRRLRRPR